MPAGLSAEARQAIRLGLRMAEGEMNADLPPPNAMPVHGARPPPPGPPAFPPPQFSPLPAQGPPPGPPAFPPPQLLPLPAQGLGCSPPARPMPLVIPGLRQPAMRPPVGPPSAPPVQLPRVVPPIMWPPAGRLVANSRATGPPLQGVYPLTDPSVSVVTAPLDSEICVADHAIDRDWGHGVGITVCDTGAAAAGVGIGVCGGGAAATATTDGVIVGSPTAAIARGPGATTVVIAQTVSGVRTLHMHASTVIELSRTTEVRPVWVVC